MSVKKLGKVYTPKNIVEQILDSVQYKGKAILEKHVIDNSSGDGAFLIDIVMRYCEEFIRNYGEDKARLKSHLEQYIHGIEINNDERLISIERLNKVVELHGLTNVKWDVINDNTIKVTKYNKKMDFVIGNPPYVRVHNLGDDFEIIKQMKFSNKGMTDLFIVFYELGLSMLNKNGKLAYITPNSIFNSLAGTEFRKYIIDNKLLSEVINLGHYQPFHKITAYTTILLLDKNHQEDQVVYQELNEDGLHFIDTLDYAIFYMDNKFYFSKKENLIRFKEIITTKKNNKILVKNGLATLRDKVFISDKFPFKSKHIIPVIKASTGQKKELIYPYDNNAKLVDFANLDQSVQEYLNSHKAQLNSRSLDKKTNWYAFGRSQAIRDITKNKVAINSLVRESADLKIIESMSGTGVYSGLYIIGLDINKIENILRLKGFIEYVKILGKYKSGGYYTYSSSDLEKYLIYASSRKE